MNLAKEEIKKSTTVAAEKGWTALRDGSVGNFMATPNAINEPLFRTIGSCLDTIARDPNTVNNVLAVMGRELQSASDKYSKMTLHDRGVQDGKAMFFFVNSEGSTEAGDLALKSADRDNSRNTKLGAFPNSRTSPNTISASCRRRQLSDDKAAPNIGQTFGTARLRPLLP